MTGARGNACALLFARVAVVGALVLTLIGCGGKAPAPARAFSAHDGKWPHLHGAPDDTVLLSWLAPLEDGHALRFARRTADGRWSAPREIARGRDWFVNWADFPSITASGESLVAHWLVRSADAPYAYDVSLARSLDNGATWLPLGAPHDDGTPTEHGFASVVPANDGFDVVWLDGRKTQPSQGHGGHGAGSMTLRHARYDRDGSRLGGGEIDGRVCDCCQTAAARSSVGLVVAYRDRSDGEIRDIRRGLLADDGWLPDAAVADDGWRIEGCPVNGPALHAAGDEVVAAWFTAADGEPAVKGAWSLDGGMAFEDALTLAAGPSIAGRVDVALLGDGEAVATWVRAVGGPTPQGWLSARRITSDGRLGEVRDLVEVDATRSGGFPRMVVVGGEMVLAWRSAAGVETAAVSVSSLPPP